MNVIPPRFFLLLFVAASSCLSPAVGRAASQWDSLLNNSPFGTAPKSGQSADTGNQPVELRGVMEENGQQFFSIYDTATKRSRWVAKNDTSGDVVIKGYDEEAHSISLERNGQPLSLTLKSGPRIAQNIQAPMPPPMQPGAVGLPGQQVMSNSMGGKSPEAQRMQQIAEEIRRRRALRQQAPNMPTPSAPVNGGGPAPLPGMSGSSGPMPVANPGGGTGPMPMPTPNTSAGPTPNPSRQ